MRGDFGQCPAIGGVNRVQERRSPGRWFRGFVVAMKDSNLRSFRDGFTVRSHWPLGQPARFAIRRLPGYRYPLRRTACVVGYAQETPQVIADRTKGTPVADSSFDIVSKVDRQEADNALNQASKEISQRFDFRNTGAKIEWNGELSVELTASTEERVSAALEVFRTNS